MPTNPERQGPARPRPGFGTRAVHGVRGPAPAESPLAVPIWQTSTFSFDDAEHYAHTLHQPREGFVYTRYENPTSAALEATVADLEGAAQGMATDSGMRAIYAETIANPTMTVADLPALAGLARAAGVPLVVDNTVASPYLCRPIEHGAAVVVHSATKYLGGHADVVGGLA